MTTNIEIWTDAVNTIDLLQSIYFDKEFEFRRSDDETLYTQLHGYWESDSWPASLDKLTLNNLEFTIKAPIEIPNQEEEEEEEEEETLYVIFNGRISLTSISEYELTLPSSANTGWLSRDDHETLVHTLNTIEIDEESDRSTWIIEKMQQLQAIAEPYAVAYIEKSNLEAQNKQLEAEGGPVKFLRDWIWFPMIYTREKRGHIIDWAPNYNITGILLGGKPGMMCLEGPEKQVINFVNDIKTISWADIPAGHRKMTSRWKEYVDCNNNAELEQARKFHDMQELKFDIHGKFANHTSLNMLQAWMQERGCGEAFDHLFEYDSNNATS